ncbi:hypothetical protein POM88_028377 [Heracleum sosnowskyi]|uniref:Uncharacterized protein n=1 Tax=Heracleum sosnowskyi TaxID=360622 RepID=A0AAD8MRU7_9APIA|nr:hypothetical protein POM88_028377 [Heracleum sosnowskyi]
MATTTFVSSGLEFVPNNYAAPLNTANAPEAFHMIQEFLAQSAIGRALVEPAKLSGLQIKAFWESGMYDDGGETGSPSIIFEYEETEYVITAGTIRAAIGFPEFSSYTIGMGDEDLIRMMRKIGYSGPLTKIGQLKRPFLRKEWSFFFDCITRTFGKKCTNWDAIPTDSLQIGYSLLYDNHFDFARLVLNNLGEKMTENRGVVYFSRFCQILFSYCVEGVEVIDEDVSCFKLHKRIFSDLINKDVKKGVVGDLLLPALVQQFLDDSIQVEQQPEPVRTEAAPSQPIRTGGRIKHRAFKPAKSVKPTTEVGVPKTSVPNSVGTSKKSRSKRPRSDAEDDTETLTQRRRRLISNYLFDESDNEAIPEAVIEAVHEDEQNVDPDVEIQDAVVEPDTVTKETEVTDEATVPIVDRINTDETPEVFLEPILEMDNEEEIQAHPSISVCDTKDVAADQPTQIVDESIATHTEILSVNNIIPEKGEEVDQVVETAQIIPEAAVEKFDEAMAEILTESDVQTEEILVNSEIPEAAQLNAEVTADNANEEAAEQLEENANEARVVSDNADHANSGINADNAELSDSDESIPFLRDHTAESTKANHNATEDHFREMHYANWSGVDCIFSTQRAADFVHKTATEITNPELLSHFKATIVQVKSLHNRFDETHKVVLGLSNDIALKELALKKDRAQISSMQKDQEEIKQRLTNVESNQTVMSSQLTSIAVSLELLTLVFIPDDVKKGEKIPKDKCRRTPTLKLRDDSNDGGSRETEKRSKSSQEQGRLRSNSARQTNSERLNSGSQSSSRLKSLVISSNPITDEEIAAKIFMEEHGNEATMEDIDAEMKLLAEEHQKKIKAGTYKKKSVKAPRKKEVGISIKENTQQSIQYTRRPVIANTDKGKGKLVEEGQLPKKIYSTSDVAQVESSINKSTSDVAHVDISTKIVTTSDKAQVVQTQLAPQLKGFLRPVLSETLTLEPVNFSQTRTILGKESYDKSGLGSHREKRINNRPLDQTSLAEAGIGVSQESLDKLESVQMVYHKGLKKEFLLYFMSDGRVYRVGEADVQLKLWEELEYVLYLLKVKNKSTHDAAIVLRDRMMKSKVLLGGGVSSAYIPKYRDAYGKIVEMKRNSAKFKTALGIKVLEFNLESDKSYYIRLGNEMRKNNIYYLRAAIYQTGEGDPELKELKEIMVEELEKAERRLLIDYLRTVPDIEEIK